MRVGKVWLPFLLYLLSGIGRLGFQWLEEWIGEKQNIPVPRRTLNIERRTFNWTALLRCLVFLGKHSTQC